MSPRTSRPLRRGVGLVAVAALTASALGGLTTTPAQAAEPTNAPVAGGAEWLSSELTGGLLVNPNFGGFNDYGLSIDAGLALAEVGDTAAVDRVSSAIAANVASYTTGVDFGSPDIYAGATAKATVLAQVAGDDAMSYGGVDLVEQLEARVITTGPSAGRIQDGSETDFSNSIGQAFAVRGLDGAGSPLADQATDFLLAQQCAEGYFRLSFSTVDAADQTCDGATDAMADTDVTALALLQLQSQADDPDVRTALDAGAAWLVETQADDGSWGGAGPTAAPNANSTGLASWALGRAGETGAASDGAAWVKGLQVTALGGCSGSAAGSDTGAIAYDAAALETALNAGVTDDTSDQFRRTTAQALPALVSLSGETVVTDVSVTGPTGYRPAGGRALLRVTGLADGEQACIAGTIVTGGGTTTVPVSLLRATGSRTYRLVRLGAPASATIDTLAATTVKYPFRARRVAQRGTQTVRASGLAAGESVIVRYQRKVVVRGTASPAGRFTATFRVGTRVGVQQVRVVGEFRNRFGARSFRVVAGR